MKQILKVNNSELSFRLKLNYNNVYSRLKMLLGKSANIFADVITKSAATTWYSSDDAEYTPLSEAPKSEMRTILVSLNSKLKAVKKELNNSPELAPFADDILEVPDNSYIFYRQTPSGYDFVLAGWGCKLAHTGVSDSGGIIKRISKSIGQDAEFSKPGKRIDIDDFDADDNTDDIISEDDIINPVTESPAEKKKATAPVNSGKNSEPEKPAEKPVEKSDNDLPKKRKEQYVIIRVINQNQKPVEYESVKVRTENGIKEGYTDENGEFDLGNLPYHSTFGVQFPEMTSIQERTFEVEPKVERYQVFIKKFVNYSPVLFVEDQNGNVVDNYNVKVVIAGQDTTLNTGSNGMIQLPTIQEGQKFIVIDSANYANSQEYSVTPENVKSPYHFTIKRTVKSKVGITVLDKDKKPLEGVTIDVNAGDTPCQQTTDKEGRAEFPSDVFSPGEMALTLFTKGKGTIKSKLNYTPDTTEYSIQLQDRKRGSGFNWKWLMLLPLILLLGLGGYWLYNKLGHKYPTLDEMESGVAFIYGQATYYADLGVDDVTINGNPPVAYVQFDLTNGGVPSGVTFNPYEADQLDNSKILPWTGTGFLISKDGLIATNRHVAIPRTKEEEERLSIDLKRFIHDIKNHYQELADNLSNQINVYGSSGALYNEKTKQEYARMLIELENAQGQVRIFDKLLQKGDFTIKKEIELYAAFTGTDVEGIKNMIPLKSEPKAVGEPGGINEIDLAILQISKKSDIPTDAFVFNVPEVDLMDGDIGDDYGVTVIGYNAGLSLQDLKNQDGIRPQKQSGHISSGSHKYLVQYDASILGGSSGSPVVNKKGELVAINNSSVDGSSLSRGVRTKYLRDLLKQVKNNKLEK